MLAAGLPEAACQANRVENLIQLFGGQVGALTGHFAHGAAGMHGFGGDVGRVLIANIVVERGGNRR